MSEQNETRESDQQTKEIAQFFFDPVYSYWPYLAVLVAISISSIWLLRVSFDMLTTVLIIFFYSIISLITTRFRYRKIETEQVDGHIVFSFRRGGVSWKILLQALLGAAIPILLAWFVVYNSILDSTEIAELIMVVASLLYIGIIPLTPALAAIPSLNLLKTEVFAKIDIAAKEFVSFNLEINPLDGYWYENREEPELIESIQRIILAILGEQKSI
ncbi:MAG: hypothetical protein ACFFF4_18665 [Candidatus Thorarchaeota archaeon]